MVLSGMTYLAERVVRRYWRYPRRERFFYAQNRPFVFDSPVGLRFELMPGEFIDRHIVADGLYERSFLRLIEALLPTGAVVVDIGANIGNHALYLARKCAAVHCFEPNPRAIARLERNIGLNGARNVHVHPFGMGSRDGTPTFYENAGGNLGKSGFVPDDEGNTRCLTLPIRNADAAISELRLDRLDFIKIDVEGMETEVFEGLRETIKHYRPMVSFEHHGGSVSPDAFERIRACLPGYTINEPLDAPYDAPVLKRVIWNIKQAGIPVLAEVTSPEQRTYENLVGIPH